MLNKTGNRLSAALLGYVILIILLFTLNPFYLAVPKWIGYTFRTDLRNLISNIVLFVPLGFFYRLTLRRRGAFLLGAIISFVIETVQIFIPVRTPSVVDILMNTAGSGICALVYDLISTHIAIPQSTVGRLRLETPLMGLIYLLVPLLWANALAFDAAPNRWILTLLIGLCGAIVFSEIFQHWWESRSYRTSLNSAFAAGIWFFIGSGPALTQPVPVLEIGLAVTLMTAILTVLPQPSKERRFERATLKRFFPVFGLYLLLLALWHPLRPLATWHVALGFTDRITEKSLQLLNPRIEYLVAFTVLGYLLAEWRGRSEIPLAQDLPRLFIYSLGIAIVLEFVVGFQSGSGASLVRAVMVVVSALFGGTIYHLLRAHIRFLLGR